jgi:hypothetical protein
MIVGRGREQAVHVGLVQAGVLQGVEGSLPDQIQGCEPGPDLPEVRLSDPDDSHLAPQTHESSPPDTKTGIGPSSVGSNVRVTLAPTSTTSSAGTPWTRLIILKPSSRSTRTTL